MDALINICLELFLFPRIPPHPSPLLLWRINHSILSDFDFLRVAFDWPNTSMYVSLIFKINFQTKASFDGSKYAEVPLNVLLSQVIVIRGQVSQESNRDEEEWYDNKSIVRYYCSIYPQIHTNWTYKNMFSMLISHLLRPCQSWRSDVESRSLEWKSVWHAC